MEPGEGARDAKEQASFFGKVRSWFGGSVTSPKERSDEDVLKDALLDCGFKVVEATAEIFENFRRSGVDVQYMTPESVLMFYRSYASDAPMCEGLGALPCALAESPLKTERVLRVVLEYCKKSGGLVEGLDGLPLMLTADDSLGQFSSQLPVFHSDHSALLPDCAGLFLKPSMLATVFADVKPTDSPVFKEFKVDDLAVFLPRQLSTERFRPADGGAVEWKRDGGGGVPSRAWLQQVWAFMRGAVDPILSSADLSADDREALVVAELSPVAAWCLVPAVTATGHRLYPLNRAEVIDSRPVDHEIQTVARKLQLPQLDADLIGSADRDVVRCMIATYEKPARVLSMLGQHFDDADRATAGGKLTQGDCTAVLRYFTEHVVALRDVESVIDKLRALPVYTTIVGDVIALSGCVVYTLPARIPTSGIDVWQNRSGMVFLERDDTAAELYELLGCAPVGVIEVYCRFIFEHFEYLSQAERIVHLHHIDKNYIRGAGGAATGGVTPEEREELIASLRRLEFLEDETGALQPASYFHDPENVVFRVMLPACRFAPPRLAGVHFSESEWFRFLTVLGMVTDVSAEMFLRFAEGIAAEGKVDAGSAEALVKSKVLVEHLLAMPADRRDEIIASGVVNVSFIACRAASPRLLALRPQWGALGGGRLGYIPFRGAVVGAQERLCWTCAPLLPEWADPMLSRGLGDAARGVAEKLGIQVMPSVELVLRHTKTLCADFDQIYPHDATVVAKTDVFRAVYAYFTERLGAEQYAASAPLIQSTLSGLPCVLVEGGRRVVLPCQTVLNLYDSDEIRPYLYRLPLEVGEFRSLFVALGTSDRATVDQYVDVLAGLRRNVGGGRMSPNELRAAYRAVCGLIDTAEASPRAAAALTATHLYLPSQGGRLADATTLVLNDAPSFYDRVRACNLEFVVDMRECGARQRNVDEILGCTLPAQLRPALLSAVVRESLVDAVQRSVSSDGIARALSDRLKSSSFLGAVVRLARHDAYKRGRKLDDNELNDVMGRLGAIGVYTVRRVMTQLSARGRAVPGSEVERACFVERGDEEELSGGGGRGERVGGGGAPSWRIYVREDGGLSQDTLIPLAEMINTLLRGLLRDSVLYLLPVLSCPEDQIQSRMDQLNIRLDHSSLAPSPTVDPTLPSPGTSIPPDLLSLLSAGHNHYDSGEYVAYKAGGGRAAGEGEKKEGAGGAEGSLVYGVVREEVVSPHSYSTYLLDLGQGQDAVIVSSEQLLKFKRK